MSALLGLGSLGAALHVAGSVLIVFGQASVKVAHAIVDSTGLPSTWAVPRAHPHPPLWRRPDGKWRRQKAGSKAYAFGGWSAFAVGNILRFIAMRFAAQTVLSGLGSLQFVIIPIASRFLLGIRASASTVVGVTVVLAGNMLIILYGPAEVTFTVEQLRRQWSTPAMTTFLLVLGTLLCALQWLYWHLTGGSGSTQLQPQLVAELENKPLVAAAAAAAGGGSGEGVAVGRSGSTDSSGGGGGGGGGGAPDGHHLLGAGSGKWVHTSSSGSLLVGREQDAVRVFAGALLFSAVASFVGAWSVLFSKSMTYVVSDMPASLADWYSWFILVAFLATAAFWVRQSDRGLRYYPASLIMPLMQAFWMCMSVLEGGIYFDELIGLPSRHLALLMLGLMLALLGAIFMGIAGFIAEKPEHIFHYRAAAIELAAEDGGADSLSPPPASAHTVEVIVEKLQAATGRIDRLSSPVLRSVVAGSSGLKNGYLSGSSSADLDATKHWRHHHGGGGTSSGLGGGSGGGVVTQVHAIAAPADHLELPILGSASPPAVCSPHAFARMQAVRSPTQQLLSRENSGSLEAALHGGGTTAFDLALAEASGNSLRHQAILLDSLASSSGKGALQRR